jgi:Protein of unknown function (DUF2809)
VLRIARRRAPPQGRRRIPYLLACSATIALGLASRRSDALTPLLGKYPGDALWAAMIYFGIVAMRPRLTVLRAAFFALTFCIAIEVLKLYQAPWLATLRHTTLGHLVFGHRFSFANLIAYAIGIAVVAGLNLVVLRRRAAQSAAQLETAER